MSKIQKLGPTSEPTDGIEDAEFVEIDDHPASALKGEPQRDKPIHNGISQRIADLQLWWTDVSLFIKVPLAFAVLFGFMAFAGHRQNAPTVADQNQQVPSSPSPIPDKAAPADLTAGEQAASGDAPGSGFGEAWSPPDHYGPPVQTNCHYGSCTWIRMGAKDELATKGGHKLVRLILISGQSGNDGAQDSTQSDDDTVRWNSEPFAVFAFCSKTLPTTMVWHDGKWQVDVLDFVSGVSGSSANSAQLYSYACHGSYGASQSDGFASRYGYRVPVQSEITVQHPSDLFAL